MERRVLVVCSVAGLLGILSSVTAFVAEATRIKVISYDFPFRFPFFALDFTCISFCVHGFLLHFVIILLDSVITEENGRGKVFFLLFMSLVNSRR